MFSMSDAVRAAWSASWYGGAYMGMATALEVVANRTTPLNMVARNSLRNFMGRSPFRFTVRARGAGIEKMLGIRFDSRSTDWLPLSLNTPLGSIRDANLVRERANSFGGAVHNT